MTLTRARGVRPMRINGTWGQMWIGSAETYSSPLTEPVSKFKSSLPRRPTQDEPVSQRSLFPVQLAILLALTGDVRLSAQKKTPSSLLPLSLCSRSSVIKKRRLITIFPSLSPLVPISLLFSSLSLDEVKFEPVFARPKVHRPSSVCIDTGDAGASASVHPSAYRDEMQTIQMAPNSNS